MLIANNTTAPPSTGLQRAGFFVTKFGEKAGFGGAPQAPEVIIGKIIQGAMIMIGVIFGILVIYGGYLWMTARGNEEQVKKSIGILTTATIGFIVVVGAYAITSYIVSTVILASYQ
ncbi:hypothetical protein A3B21_05035 [Candidatus Uhrbacteria bacterium RIFCSPLOWO2_01_FULL_47_24]|uniref:Uncharacterized protein n=1 Tax=Candidatus Uhrbacteria bacterium RIFCSPLOWO2_01_FULL_47_24 TaxID=1802401 RepID=A0A1F7UUT5_9BACT|nr:MAG: hypothetical protein A2753_03070 [Candidatus Uhrbacteria bacterium RIFCSPHIGHO2_01_FULL_47_11]OGL69316.1 MAG: hypothetical protein A3D58_03425 [Candidatus Uhrbacteria bacterium RIFCSPHIGHO2_02_FULL_46_47]OGL76386.1 MAG: hypothetical protein A3F52_00715 [Candidatus Uhrbacteria bacterium RIFCSPHIGHO2_12_FULL_47_11]OGL82051.1 MAG: hypothetical protein A3B21_05035 [Candidatus Uhrbacteria bacterium RIFCSPLOWO2_01_FULL_47_24]OGL85445.1 MAG: hypothetical protein A3J03_05200 [Candidatus Uhrbact